MQLTLLNSFIHSYASLFGSNLFFYKLTNRYDSIGKWWFTRNRFGPRALQLKRLDALPPLLLLQTVPRKLLSVLLLYHSADPFQRPSFVWSDNDDMIDNACTKRRQWQWCIFLQCIFRYLLRHPLQGSYVWIGWQNVSVEQIPLLCLTLSVKLA